MVIQKLITALRRISLSTYMIVGFFLVGYGVLSIYLQDKIPFTPDFLSTDVFHFNYSYKYYLWKTIRSGMLPFWTNQLGAGAPLVAESQMGVFFLPYYIIFPLFSSFSHAYAFLFAFHLFIFSLGMYVLLRTMKSPPLLALLLTLTLVWNGSISFRWVHFNVIQAFSLVPLLYLMYIKWNSSKATPYLFAMAIVLNQMIVVGFIQIVFIALIGLICLFFIQNSLLNKRKIIAFFLSLGLGVLLSLPQILPTMQLSQYTSRTISSSYDFAVSVPFAVRNMCSFFSVRCLGSAQDATYSQNWQTDGIYWENTPYLGEYFIIALVVSTVLFLILRRRNNTLTKPLSFLFLFILFTLFALGKNTPLYFIFSIFPFSMFRTPSRYLPQAIFFLIIYASSLFTYVIHKSKILAVILYTALALNCIVLINMPFTYHLFVKSSEVELALSTQKLIDRNTFYLTYGAAKEWNTIFSGSGWKTNSNKEDYLFITSALLPNSNLISGQSSFDIYASLTMRRHQYIQSLLIDGLDSAKNDSSIIENLLDLYSISTIISFKPLSLPHFVLINTMKRGDLLLRTYQNRSISSFNTYYVPHEIERVSTLETLEEKIKSGTLTKNNALVESLPVKNMINPSDAFVKNITIKDMYRLSNVTTSTDTFLILPINWYPEWKLYIDHKESKLYKTNLTQIGFIVPKGTHRVEMIFIPMSLYGGCIISGVSLLGLLLFLLKTIKRSK